MKKRPRKRQAKRTRGSSEEQQRRMLSKRVRELYPGDGTDDDSWHRELERQELAAARPRAGRAGAGAETAAAGGELRGGLVVAVSSGSCQVDAGGELLHCVLPSGLARDQSERLAVGDEVRFAAHGDDHRVAEVRPRRTVLSRPDPHNPRRHRVIAANVDIVVHVASVVAPPLRLALVDRYLIAIERGGAEAVVAVNKVDLLADAEQRRRELAQLEPYRELGLRLLPCSAVHGEGIDALRRLLTGRTAVFAGHSGVGKSSLVNALGPRRRAVTARARGRDGRGRHTTTRSRLYHLDGGIRLIDTPGIREFGLWQLNLAELTAYFPDFDDAAAGCRFSNCSHTHEPDCGVRAAVDAGSLRASRFATYQRIYASLATDRRG